MPESPKKILIIDDDEFFAQILTDSFIESGFTVFNAYDGVEGVRVYMEMLPDVVLCDLIMPHMGGADTCTEIGRLDGENQPVIAMLSSTFQKPPHEHDVPEMGARVHIPKYTRPVDIVIIVEQLLERKKYLPDR
jgi:two-component system, OmpR family, response regulator